jgi:hypothetical protein
MLRPQLAGPWLAAILLLSATPARAGLWRPVLELLRPELEARLTRACVDAVGDTLEQALAGAWPSGGSRLDQGALQRQLREPCRRLAAPGSRCLVREADASDRSLALLQELLQRQLGPESERLLQRCTARLLGLPPDSLAGLSLRQLAQRLGARRP